MNEREMREAIELARACLDPATTLAWNIDPLKLCRALLAVHAECERMRPVYEAAAELNSADWADATMGGGIRSTSPALTEAICRLYNAIDQARAKDGG